MKKSKFSEQQIFSILKRADAGEAVGELCRKASITATTFYRWKSKYGGLELSDLKRLRAAEHELSKLKQMYADLSLENRALKDLIERKL